VLGGFTIGIGIGFRRSRLSRWLEAGSHCMPQHAGEGRGPLVSESEVSSPGGRCLGFPADRRPDPHAQLEQSAERPLVDGLRVFKFGGSSLATPDCIRAAVRIVLDRIDGMPAVVVVSAFQGATDHLLECAQLAARNDPAWEHVYGRIAAHHRSAVDSLLGGGRARGIRVQVDQQLGELRDTLQQVRAFGHGRPAMDLVASFGERLSARIVASHLNQFADVEFVDARHFVTTDDDFTRASVMLRRTTGAARRYFASFWRQSFARVPVVTGFIGRTDDGRTTTIGRNGSDYTAAIIGAALGASRIEIWTDVDGVLSADPRTVASAFTLPHLTYDEAAELAHFGARVLHAGTIGPAAAESIPIVIKNTFNPAAPGTLISRRAVGRNRPVNGIASIDDVTLLTLRSRLSLDSRDTAERLFRALAASGVNVILSAQAASARTVSLVVQSSEADAAAHAIRREFRAELRDRTAVFARRRDQAIVTLIGAGAKRQTQIVGALSSALGQHDVSVAAVARGLSERRLTCIVDSSQRRRALNVIHDALFEGRRRLALAVVGVGNVGGALLRQLRERHASLVERGIDLRVVALADSRRCLVRRDGIDLRRWREELDASTDEMSPGSLAEAIAGLELGHAVLVDCTAASAVVDAYPAFIKASLDIVTPNKRASTQPWRRYLGMKQLLARHRTALLCESNVGAGLPVIATLHDLMAGGDTIAKIEGIFSGTLSYLFNTFDGDAPFSLLVRDAHAMGYTEPDPRDDLSGEDVARKLLILARQIGLKMELEQVEVEGLVPPHLRDMAFSPQFFTAYATHDAEIQERVRCARSRGAVVRYVGTLENGRARAQLRELPRDHPFATTAGTDNVVAFTTSRYTQTPLILRGPGAGAEVTAGSVLSDVVKLARSAHRQAP
jgi:aspartokinase/homoserine dehydrogenase 1